MHSIRLRGPWQYEIHEIHPDSDPTGTSRTGQIKLPADWAQAISDQENDVRMELTRSFNAPTGIESSRISLEVTNLGPPAELKTSLTINGQQVEATIDDESQRFDITSCLAQHNQLAIQVTLNPTRKYFGEVTIQLFDL